MGRRPWYFVFGTSIWNELLGLMLNIDKYLSVVFFYQSTSVLKVIVKGSDTNKKENIIPGKSLLLFTIQSTLYTYVFVKRDCWERGPGFDSRVRQNASGHGVWICEIADRRLAACYMGLKNITGESACTNRYAAALSVGDYRRDVMIRYISVVSTINTSLAYSNTIAIQQNVKVCRKVESWIRTNWLPVPTVNKKTLHSSKEPRFSH